MCQATSIANKFVSGALILLGYEYYMYFGTFSIILLVRNQIMVYSYY
jgi:hypothetical protein